jgi:hypothetical protein
VALGELDNYHELVTQGQARRIVIGALRQFVSDNQMMAYLHDGGPANRTPQSVETDGSLYLHCDQPRATTKSSWTQSSVLTTSGRSEAVTSTET